ncbi:hypothetical protein VB638_13440 [Dolichospermum sp. UHCC 0684]|jgi:hypothetical protein|uniref:hypothetical protein n=1 Tax=unclassified Dolichospermum TaxID=2622029 RepID=UPI00143D7135|nr:MULTISPECIES: hypothetical protein [unclassified Dolichospermum]MBS9387651.1 hypothetical protein [Dolichospermum sp. WA123]MEA5530573.1 hypothetical protein [Dolichospermum sp. UHCC 0684]
MAYNHHPLQVLFKHNKKPIDGKSSLKVRFETCGFEQEEGKVWGYKKIFLTLILS